jgi:hypothetical protein
VTSGRRPWWWRWAWFAPLAFAACAGPRFEPPPTPYPTPTPQPGPVEPQPTGRVLTEAEVDGVALGTTEADLVSRFGRPMAATRLDSQNAVAFVYAAKTVNDPTRFAEFWLRGGVVVHKVVY